MIEAATSGSQLTITMTRFFEQISGLWAFIFSSVSILGVLVLGGILSYGRRMIFRRLWGKSQQTAWVIQGFNAWVSPRHKP
jgi:hypothetical protein